MLSPFIASVPASLTVLHMGPLNEHLDGRLKRLNRYAQDELSCSSDLFNFLIFWPCRVACGILGPRQGSNLHPLQWKHRVLTTGPPGKSLAQLMLESLLCSRCLWVGIHMWSIFFTVYAYPERSILMSPPQITSSPIFFFLTSLLEYNCFTMVC